MFKKSLWAILALALLAAPAKATDHYFNNGSPDNTLPCTSGDKCDSFAGTTLDNAGAVACGDTINLDRGEEWEAVSEASVILRSGTTSCSGNPIYVQATPGTTGANPVLYGATVTSTGWSVFSGTIYVQSAAQSQTHLKTVVYNATDTVAANYKGLFYWSGTTSTLPVGTFKRTSNTLYVHLWSSEDPATSNVRIPQSAHTSDADGSRGLLSGGRRTDGATYGHHLRFRDITIVGPNGVGFSNSGTNSWDAGLLIIGAGTDGWLAYEDLSSSLENSDNYRSYGTTVKYSAAGANGAGGGGQGWTTYAKQGWWVYARSEFNAMAGYDWLNFGPSTVVTEAGCFWCYATDNGLARSDPSYDANYYIDGGYRIFIYGSQGHRGGLGSGTAGNARTGMFGGSEHPTTDPTYAIYFVNNWIDTNFWVAAGADNATSSTANLTDFTFAYNTLIAYRGGGQSWVLQANDWDTTVVDSYKIKNNILYAENSGAVNTNWSSANVATWVDSDGNQIYKQGGSNTPWRIDSTNVSLASWQSTSGEDAASAFGDPLFVNDTEGSFDITLQGGSPAIDRGVVGAYTVPSWLPQTVKDYLGTAGIRGSTIAAGTEDNYNTAPDAGYHKSYGEMTSTNMEPASLEVSTAGTMSMTVTLPDIVGGYIPYNGGIKFTLPAGYTISSGGTTAFTSSTISGTWNACSISGQDVTCMRVGDGNSEFPGTYTGSLSNIGNSATPGATGVYKIYILDSSGAIITQDLDVDSDTLTSPAAGPHLQCSGKAFSSTGKWSLT